MWTFVYCGCAFSLSIITRFRSWYSIHDHIHRIKMFFLIDAHDSEELASRAWKCVKVSVMIMSLALCFGLIGISYYYDAEWSSFVSFVGSIFGVYYAIVKLLLYVFLLRSCGVMMALRKFLKTLKCNIFICHLS